MEKTDVTGTDNEQDKEQDRDKLCERQVSHRRQGKNKNHVHKQHMHCILCIQADAEAILF